MNTQISPQDTWHQYTCRGNTEYKLACYGNAILMHNQALDHARHQFASGVACGFGQALHKVMISHFSLADCYRALEQPCRAAGCYLEALRFLRQATESLPTADSAMEAVLQAGSHLHALWCEFVQASPDIPDPTGLQYHLGSQALSAALMQHAVLH